jgi:hypothetical protein
MTKDIGFRPPPPEAVRPPSYLSDVFSAMVLPLVVAGGGFAIGYFFFL